MSKTTARERQNICRRDVSPGMIFPVDGRYPKLLAEGLCEMTEIRKPDLAAGLFDTALPGDQQVFCALQPAFIVVVIQGMTIYLFEEVLEFTGAHEYFVRQGLQRGEALQPSAEDLFYMLHTFQIVLFYGPGKRRLLLTEEGVQKLLDEVGDTGEHTDIAQGIGRFQLE